MSTLRERFLTEVNRLKAKAGVSLASHNRFLREIIKNRVTKSMRESYESASETGKIHPAQRAYGVSLLPFLEKVVTEKPKAAQSLVDFAFTWQDDMKKRAEFKEQGLAAPVTGVVDFTARCNLKCPGCYAASLSKGADMPYSILEQVVNEMRDAGVTLITGSGGEPYITEIKERAITRIGELLKEKGGSILVYTNGTLINEETAKRMGDLQNIWPAFSEEGTDELTIQRRGPKILDQIKRSRDLLNKYGVMYGASITGTSDNADEIAHGSFFEKMLDKGYNFMWIFIAQPIGRGGEWGKMVTGKQRFEIGKRVTDLRFSGYPLLVGDFWNDGLYVAETLKNGQVGNACIAGDKYFHIRADSQSDGLERFPIKVCVFAPFASGTLADIQSFSGQGQYKNLQDFLTRNTDFAFFRERKQTITTPEAPCTLIDHPRVSNSTWLHGITNGTTFSCSNMPETYFEGEVAELRDQRSKEWVKEYAPELREYQEKAVQEFLASFSS